MSKGGPTIIPDKPSPADVETVQQKLNPRRFSDMSPKMAAIVGFVVGKKYTRPGIASMYVTSDGFVIARPSVESGGTSHAGHEQFIGTLSQLEDNWERLLDATELTIQERAVAERLFQKISDFRNPEPFEFHPPSGTARRPAEVRVSQHLRRRHYIEDRFGHRVYVGSEKWPSQRGLSKLRHHYKREHPRAFRASIRKGVVAREKRQFIRLLNKDFSKKKLKSLGWTPEVEKAYLAGKTGFRGPPR